MKQFKILDAFPEEKLPPCSELKAEDAIEEVTCTNETIAVEPRFNDPIFERLFAQLWEDYQTSMNTQSSLYGTKNESISSK